MERVEYEVLAAVEPQHWWHSGMRAIATAMLDTYYAKHNDLHILDAGCGTGGNVLFLQRYGHVVGIDIAAEAMELTCAPNRVIHGSVLHLPFADNQFDLITSFDVLYHRGVPDERIALREFHRVLGHGGRLLIRLPAYEFLRSKHDRSVHTRQRYTANQVQTLLHETGFIVQRCTYVNSLLFPIPLAQRMLERAMPFLEQHDSDLALPSPLLNESLHWPMVLEATWLGFGGAFPFGLSIVCLAHCGKFEHVRAGS